MTKTGDPESDAGVQGHMVAVGRIELPTYGL